MPCTHCQERESKLKAFLDNYKEIPLLHTILSQLSVQSIPAELSSSNKEELPEALFSILPYTLWPQ